MNVAASPEFFATLRRHLQSDGIDRPAAEHLASEMVAHPDEQLDTSIEKFQEYKARLESMGFESSAADHLAVEALESGEPPRRTRRYEMTEEEERPQVIEDPWA
jgi:hypothetical protein